jgi:hypothetical protein
MIKHIKTYAPIYIIILVSLFVGAFIEQEIVRYRLDNYIKDNNIKLDKDLIMHGKTFHYSDYSH